MRFYPCLIVDTNDKIIYGKKIKKSLMNSCEKVLINHLTADEIEHFAKLDKIISFLQTEKQDDFLQVVKDFNDKKLSKQETISLINIVSDYLTNVKKHYVSFVQLPGYNPVKNVELTLDDLYDDDAYKKLLAYIDSLNLNNSEKHFLRLAATRFLRFDFRLIADYYYSTDNEELRSAFRTLLLVLVDENEVIQNEYVTLTKRVLELFKREYGDVRTKNKNK